MTHHYKLRGALAFVFFSNVFALGRSGDVPDLTYRSTAAEVRLTFFATDGHNQTIRTLQPSDFAVVDDDLVIRDFRSFTPSEVTSLDITVLVDSSESVASQLRHEITDTLPLISQTPWIAEDHLSIVKVAGLQPKIICAGNCQNASAASFLTAPAGGLTPLFDAVIFAANRVSQHRDPHVRPALILFSDGEDTISKGSLSDAIYAAVDHEAQIYAVDVNESKRVSGGTPTLARLAESTGGRYFRMQDGTGKVLDAVLEDLRAAYVVTYKPPSHRAGLHSVRILPTHNLNLQFHCRRSYFDRGSVR